MWTLASKIKHTAGIVRLINLEGMTHEVNKFAKIVTGLMTPSAMTVRKILHTVIGRKSWSTSTHPSARIHRHSTICNAKNK